MLKVITQKDVGRIDNPYIAAYVQNLVDYFFREYKDYCAESLEALGAIFILEDSSDWNLFSEMGLSAYTARTRDASDLITQHSLSSYSSNAEPYISI